MTRTGSNDGSTKGCVVSGSKPSETIVWGFKYNPRAVASAGPWPHHPSLWSHHYHIRSFTDGPTMGARRNFYREEQDPSFSPPSPTHPYLPTSLPFAAPHTSILSPSFPPFLAVRGPDPRKRLKLQINVRRVSVPF